MYYTGERNKNKSVKNLPSFLRWPHMQADQVRGLSLREIGGGFSKHHRAPSIRVACYAIAKPSSMVPKMQNIKKLRGHRDAVYCGMYLCLDFAAAHGFFQDVLIKQWTISLKQILRNWCCIYHLRIRIFPLGQRFFTVLTAFHWFLDSCSIWILSL